MSCNCRICIEYREIDEMIESRNIDLFIEKVKDLESRLSHAELDRDVNDAVLKGDWPSSIEILERCLKRAREKNEKEIG